MIARLPYWLRQEIPDARALATREILARAGLNTVCVSAKCPNINGCFGRKKATFMILGDTCTRDCAFCNVKKSRGSPLGIDTYEPDRISKASREMGLDYVVVTSVTRDDLADAGAGQFARVVDSLHEAREANENIRIELLIPDFQGRQERLRVVLDSGPDVVGHNLETVRRLYPHIRRQADYNISLEVLRTVKKLKPRIIAKSSLMLGLGETHDEVVSTMHDLREHECDCLTLGQYLAPTGGHYPVKEFIEPAAFNHYEILAREMGFKSVLSAPRVRSSYRAEEVYRELIHA